MTEKRLPIKPFLKAFDLKRFDLYRELSGDQEMRKEFDKVVGYILPLWMSAASNPTEHASAIIRFNRAVNTIWFGLSKHPELQAKLLALIGTGKEANHTFFKANRAVVYPKLTELLRTIMPDIRKHEVVSWCRKYTKTDLTELAEAQGTQKDEIKALHIEYEKIMTDAV